MSLPTCGEGAVPLPKLLVPPLSKYPESKIIKPLDAVGEARGAFVGGLLLTPEKFPRDPLVLLGVVFAPLYSQIAVATLPCWVQVEGIPLLKSSDQIRLSGPETLLI
jgi:hypothetical protein